MIERVCVIGAGSIGSLFAGHLAQVADVSVLTRRTEHAEALEPGRAACHGPERPPCRRHRVCRPRRDRAVRPRHRGDQGERPRGRRGVPRGSIPRSARDDDAQRAGRRGGRPRARRLAHRLRGDVHVGHEALRHRGRVRARHRHLDGAVRGHAARAGRGGRRPRPAGGARGRGAAQSSPGAVVEADLQRHRELRGRAHRAPARPPLRRRRGAVRPRAPRPRARRRGQGGRRGGRRRALRGPVGDERPRDPEGLAHYPSMLEDVEAHRPTEIDLITGSLVREAGRHGVPVPLHTALYRLVKAKEASWREPESNRQAHQEA